METNKLIDLDFLKGLKACGIEDKVLKGTNEACEAIIYDCMKFSNCSYEEFVRIAQNLVTINGNYVSNTLEVSLNGDILKIVKKELNGSFVETKYLMRPVLGLAFERHEVYYEPTYIEHLYQRREDLVTVVATSKIEGQKEYVVEGMIAIDKDLSCFDMFKREYSPDQIMAIKQFYQDCLIERWNLNTKLIEEAGIIISQQMADKKTL